MSSLVGKTVKEAGLDNVDGGCVGLMVAVSSSFATPIGSPTHMIVYDLGGYRFSDFARIGITMNFIIWMANLFITLMLFPFR